MLKKPLLEHRQYANGSFKDQAQSLSVMVTKFTEMSSVAVSWSYAKHDILGIASTLSSQLNLMSWDVLRL